MRVKRIDKCYRCKDVMKLNDVRVEDDLIIVEYICDCGHMQKKILDEIIYCNSDEHRYN